MLKLIDKGCFGKCQGRVYTIEFQKRGLPHIHILIFLHPEHRLQQPEQIDRLISTQLPDPDLQPELFKLVEKLMIHGPCGEKNPEASCMKNGKCTKGFPKPFQAETSLSENGYPIYAWPDNGRKCHKRVNGQLIEVDNSWVVPYNPWCLLQWRSHANLECCISIKSTKYIHKYICKGHDRTTMGIGTNQDEVQLYLDSRYISASEACWRIFHYDMHEEQPNIIRLAVHTPEGQYVTSNAENGQSAQEVAL